MNDSANLNPPSFNVHLCMHVRVCIWEGGGQETNKNDLSLSSLEVPLCLLCLLLVEEVSLPLALTDTCQPCPFFVAESLITLSVKAPSSSDCDDVYASKHE